ncbi:hypothetical protein [Spirochaeta isovalerica]|uniref:Uncharacterized protein n=1 Tax=Spirochaeta isovalerica TaxID=150 RepID=A0A841R9A3_9SPIO|nr:hypothetical protein [Spirochaeta isovalerica]MBB6480485.1 hypothetical protein [Spirochaeta isovalerica]
MSESKGIRKISSILLLGSLSMLFAEVFSGASQLWFIQPWGWLLTFPLYLSHVLFFMWIAFKLHKTSLLHLYLFGVLFGLYESWITKVLWAGYMNETGPGFGTLFSLAMPEFPILVFFWHPLMSFILPVLVYEVLTKQVLNEHEWILRKSVKKSIILSVLLFLFSSFLAKGNQFDLISANLSLGGTLLLIILLFFISGNPDSSIFYYRRKPSIAIVIYLILLYTASFFLLVQDRIPLAILPFVSIIVCYIIVFLLIGRSKRSRSSFRQTEKNLYSPVDLIPFALISMISINLTCLLPDVSNVLLIMSYLALIPAGMAIFLGIALRIFAASIFRKCNHCDSK